jgi:type I restriction enzyme M protein
MFYNTGIATYIWVLTNRKPEHRRGRVQLIDATHWFKPLCKNLGKKNFEPSEEDIARICDVFLRFEETGQSKIFPNAAFGYWKVTVERPLRLRIDLTDEARTTFRKTCAEEGEETLASFIDRAAAVVGPGPHLDFTAFLGWLQPLADKAVVKLTVKRLKLIQNSLAQRDESASRVLKRVHKLGKVEPDPLRGFFDATVDGKPCVVEYEPDSELRDTEQVPLLEDGGVEAFIRREVLPHAPDAWIDESATRIGYEISFTRYFYKPQPLRPLEAIRADILAVEQETKGLLSEIIGGMSA